MKNKEIGTALVVTYNRKEELEYCIQCLLKQTCALDKIYVVNNASTDNTEDFLREICQQYSQVRYITNKENLGGAGGFEIGIKWAYEDGADWIWGMDDDAFPDESALENLLIERKKIEGINAFWSNCNNDDCFKGNIKEVEAWMFVGFFIPRDIVKCVGFPRGDFFIYYDDLEYAGRIIKNGYHIYKIKNSVIQHKDSVSDMKIINILNKPVKVIMLPRQNWKLYYLVRNDFIITPRGDKRRKKLYMREVRRIVKTIIYNPRQLGILLMGIWHGIIGKTGKIVSP